MHALLQWQMQFQLCNVQLAQANGNVAVGVPGIVDVGVNTAVNPTGPVSSTSVNVPGVGGIHQVRSATC